MSGLRKIVLLVVLALFMGSGCTEFIEPSLAKAEMRLLAPAEATESNSYQQTFWWQQQQDALWYRLQIVTPSFTRVEKLLLDTLVSADKFTYTLDPGSYQWRVRAENGSSQTPFSTQSFTIYPASLKEQIVQVVAPANTLFTASAELKYSWLNLFGASGYRLQVDQNNFVDENKLVLNEVTDNLTFTQTLSLEGKYQFRVRAENATENSKWSAVREFSYDATPPLQVTLTSPANKQTVATPLTLRWDELADATKYELVVYKSDSTTLFSSIYPQLVSGNSATFNAGSAGETIVWRVRAIDRVGNKGVFSGFFSFIVQ
ncbi:hypothetical protein GM921_09870 [Pedobacter sp. LMG 31464]|uniref:Fibronectin type-III domain-containing protein n=1 Tax=Pedobacter planticolens TaxID=2679964 RepID=A0A923E1E8_9SPHI|nr:hypothetical protein [Pedobacter planticolens]MBB2145794.1 hypothetical protein [Pedobacter planticolens]